VGIIPFDYPMQMDAAGDMIGVYVDTTNSLMHGFIRSLSGTITTFDAPGAGGVPAALHRQLARAFRHGKSNVRGRGISARGKGFMKGLAGVLPVMRTGLHSPIGASAKGMSLPSLPGGINGSGTAGISINSSGMITGVYGSSDAEIHGFVRSAAGAMTDYDVPAAGTGAYEGTISFAVNGAGEVGGAYLDENNVFHGFTATLAGVATTVDLTADPTSAVYAQPVTLTATVAGGTIPDGESVQFLNGTTALGTSTTTTGGVATFTTMDLPLATNSITAVYGGDSTYEGSTSAAVNVTVGQSGTTTALTSSANPSGTGDSVTLTAAVSGTYGGTPTGSVTFYNGSSSLGSGTLSGGTATSATTALPIGTDSLTAVYSGDSNYKTSTSTALSQVVSGPTFSLAASGTQSLTVSPGGQGSVMFTITPMYGFNSAITFACSGLPTGASCSFNPTSVTPTAATTETVTIAVPANSAMLQRGHDTGRDTGGGAHWPMLGIALVGSLAGWRKRRRLSGWVVLALAVACLGMSACGKSSSSTPTTSNVTVTATAGSVQQTLTIALTVN
jgi:predicted membrane protein